MAAKIEIMAIDYRRASFASTRRIIVAATRSLDATSAPEHVEVGDIAIR
jgi:hypothetical protein